MPRQVVILIGLLVFLQGMIFTAIKPATFPYSVMALGATVLIAATYPEWSRALATWYVNYKLKQQLREQQQRLLVAEAEKRKTDADRMREALQATQAEMVREMQKLRKQQSDQFTCCGCLVVALLLLIFLPAILLPILALLGAAS